MVQFAQRPLLYVELQAGLDGLGRVGGEVGGERLAVDGVELILGY